MAEKVHYFINLSDPKTSATITTAKVGQEFDMSVYVQDLRPNGTWVDDGGVVRDLVRGVFAAYCDVSYLPSKCLEVSLSYGPLYRNGREYHGQNGMINDTGAFASAFTGDTDQHLLFTVRMKALATGKAPFVLGFKTPRPQQDTLVYGNIAAQPPEQSYVNTDTELRVTNATLTITV